MWGGKRSRRHRVPGWRRGGLRTLLAGLALASGLTAGACGSKDPAAIKADAIRVGDEATAGKDHNRAVRAYREALAVDRLDGRVLFKLSKSLWAAEQWGPAAIEGIRAADRLPDDVDAQVWGASMLLAQSRYIDASDRAAALHAKHPDNTELLILRGNASAHLLNSTWGLWRLDESIRKGVDYEWTRSTLRPATMIAADKEAESFFRRALEREPDSMDAQLALVSFLWAVGRPGEGELLLRGVADKYPWHLLANSALGRFYSGRGQTADAEKYIRAAVVLNDRDARVALADILMTSGRAAEALPILESLAADGDSTRTSTIRAADAERLLGRHDTARQRLQGILASEPRHAVALQRYAELLLDSGALAPALVAARDSVQRDPRAIDAQWTLARALSESGDLSSAFEHVAEAQRLDPTSTRASRDLARLALALGRNDVALEFARQAVRRNPDDREATADLVRALLRTRDFRAADAALAPLRSRDPNSAPLLLLSAALESARGRTAAVRTLYQRAYDIDRDSIDALTALVDLDLRASRAADARARVDEAIARHPESPGILVLVARVSMAEGDHRQAEALLRRALLRAPADVSATLLMSDALAAGGRRDEAVRALEEGLIHRPSSVEFQVALAGMLEAVGRTADAKARYRSTVVEHPDAPVPAHRLATLLVRDAEDLDLALTLATRAKKDLPNDPAVSATLGSVYVLRKLHAVGLPHLQDAVRAEPANAGYHYQLGLAYLGTGQRQRGRDEISKALELDAGFPQAGEARSRLAALR